MSAIPPTLIPISTPPDKWPVVGYTTKAGYLAPVGFIACESDQHRYEVTHYHPMPVLPEPRVAWVHTTVLADNACRPLCVMLIQPNRPPGEGWTRWEERPV